MKIGNVQLDNEVFLSPMAGVTDLPFRTICKEKGCGMLYTEMINAKALCYDDENTKKTLINSINNTRGNGQDWYNNPNSTYFQKSRNIKFELVFF